MKPRGTILKRKPHTRGGKPTWWARVNYVDPETGKRRDLQRRAKSKRATRKTLETSWSTTSRKLTRAQSEAATCATTFKSTT